MKLSAKHFALAALLLALLILSYIKTNPAVLSEHERCENLVRSLQRLDAAQNRDIVKARSRMLDDYDNFGEQISDFKRNVANLAIMPSFVSEAARKDILPRLNESRQLISRKDELLESFKSQNAVMNNSLRYLPVASTALIRQISIDAEAHELEAPLNELLRQVLVYDLDSSVEQALAISTSSEQIKRWRLSHRDHPQARALATLIAHVEAIVAHRPKLEAITSELLSLPMGENLDELLRLYNREFDKTMHAAGFYRLALYALCGLLLLGIAYTIYALDAANSHLEHRVRERTNDLSNKNEQLLAEIAERKRAEAELEKLHRQLVDASRQAGMAEIATGVLHNVGNVLNSVNVSSNILAERTRKSKISSLPKVVALMRERSADLPTFLSEDPKGKKIVEFLGDLSNCLGEEQVFAMRELDLLRKNVEHIKDIVAMQQTYATVSGVTEIVKVKELVEDALRMNASSLDRHEVEAVFECAEVPPITLDKHKALQILVNLIRNAKHACDETARSDKRVMVRVSNGGGSIKVAVADNGVGIPPENLTRIFNHGFTTKKGGHGFGLHSGALAAKQIGGSLSAHSEGSGRGATFTLELPLQNASPRHV